LEQVLTKPQAARQRWRELDTPAVLVDADILSRNIAAMQALASRTGVRLRPHAKTHKSVAIARRQLDAGAIGLTVAKLEEAAVFADAGVNDILVANQIAGRRKIARAVALAKRVTLTVGADNREMIEMLASAARGAMTRVNVSIEIDSGLKRCGVPPSGAADLAKLIDASPSLRLAGLFTHGGHAYGAADRDALLRAAAEECDAVLAAAHAIRAHGIAVQTVSIGSTPTMSVFEGREGISEIRPGNYVFNDGMQVSLGVAAPETCALSVAATVISRPSAIRVVIDAGSKTLALDRGAHGVGAIDHYGVLIGGEGRLVRLSEEHGVMDVPASSALRPGDVVRVLPNHACVVVNLARELWFVAGDEVAERVGIEARDCSR